MIELSEHNEGVILPVQAQAGGSRNGVRGQQVGRLKVAVTQVAEKGKANEAFVVTIAQALGLKKSQVVLLSGETQAQKTFLVEGTSWPALVAKIKTCLNIGK